MNIWAKWVPAKIETETEECWRYLAETVEERRSMMFWNWLWFNVLDLKYGFAATLGWRGQVNKITEQFISAAYEHTDEELLCKYAMEKPVYIYSWSSELEKEE